MSEKIPITQTVFDKNKFSKTIDIGFRELNTSQPIAPEITIEEFFRIYDELFLSIPKEGDINSHQYILKREADILGAKFRNGLDTRVLTQEIEDLKKQIQETGKGIESSFTPSLIENSGNLDEILSDIQELDTTTLNIEIIDE